MNWREQLRGQTLAALLAAIIVGVPAWFLTETPQIRVSGYVTPNPAAAGSEIEVIWETTTQGEACPGRVQREFITSDLRIWPTLDTFTIRYADRVLTGEDKGQAREGGTIIRTKVEIPEGATPGPATYRVSTFHFCNAIQRFFSWPAVQVGPDVAFDIAPKVAK